MKRPRRLGWSLAVTVCVAGLGWTQMTDRALTARRLPTPERLRITRLKATHEAVVALRAQHRPVKSPDGLLDLRCVIHAHSSLSHDSRGTLEGMVKAARVAGVQVIMTTEHLAKDRDVVAHGLRGLHSGVLFIAGTEEQNLLTFPTMLKHDGTALSRSARIRLFAGQPHGLVFIAHPEEIEDWALGPFHGMEIYNTHADLKDELELLRMLTKDIEFDTAAKLWEAWKFLPAESLACIQDAPLEILKRWDSLTLQRRVVGIAGNDSHENTRFILKKKDDSHVELFDFYNQPRGVIDARTVPAATPWLRLLRQKKIGDRLMTATLDPYEHSFRYVNTHVLAREQTEIAVREALAAGHAYVSFDWIADPSGTFFRAIDGAVTTLQGDEVKRSPTLALEFGTTLEVVYRLIHNGEVQQFGTGRSLHVPITQPGVYRVECWLQLGDELRPWLYTNPIYVR